MMQPWEKGICDMDSICITLKAVHNQLAAQERWPGVSGQVESYSVAFELGTPDWDGLSVTAVFTDGTVSKDVLGIKAGEAVPVPHECMATAGRTVSVALYGTDSGGVVLNTNYARLFRTGAGADPAGDTSADPTLPVWAQIQGQIGDLDELDTEDKSSLVAAINEAAQSGGGGTGGTTDHAKLKNRDAANQHPIGAITGLETALAEKYSAENPPPSGTSLGITSATVGQIAKITAVDDSGAPTAWEPVDMPTGGGGTWELIKRITIAEGANEASALAIDTDELGNAFSLKKARIYGRFPKYTGESTIPNFSFFMLNGIHGGPSAPYCYTSGWVTPTNGGERFSSVFVDLSQPGLQCEFVSRSNGTTGINYFGENRAGAAITSIGGTNMLIFSGCKFWLYGVRA